MNDDQSVVSPMISTVSGPTKSIYKRIGDLQQEPSQTSKKMVVKKIQYIMVLPYCHGSFAVSVTAAQFFF